ncbi:MAG: TetR family transcriptional regulator C-terminal domain-containing protein [Gammaproteobacteria bacterium]
MKRTHNKQINRDKLLDNGVKLLIEQGYHGTGLQEILAAVEIPKGSFYQYFGSKEQFGAEVIQYYIEPFIKQLGGHLQNPEIDALTALRRYFDELIAEMQRQDFRGGCLLGNLMGEIGDTSEICRISLHAAVRRYRDLMCKALARAQREGSIRHDIAAETLADLLVNAWQGALLRMKIERSVVPLQQCRELFLEEFFTAL